MSGTDPWDSDVNNTKPSSHGAAYKWSARHTMRCQVQSETTKEIKQGDGIESGEGMSVSSICYFLLSIYFFIILFSFHYFIHVFKYLLSADYIPGTAVGAGDTAINKTYRNTYRPLLELSHSS